MMRNTGFAGKTCGLVGVSLILCAIGAEAQLVLLHKFMAGSSDGASPYHGAPVVSGSTLYGMTRDGGSFGRGTVFQVDTDGGNFRILHTFAGDYRDGEDPYGSLTLAGSTLYGMTALGGDPNWGTLFKMNIDGTGFTLLHDFSRSGYDGGMPYGSLTLAGSELYGMTRYGGTSGNGTIFKINTDGSGFTLLHSFVGGASDGANPNGDLLLTGSTLYGMTQTGGNSGRGVVFKINTDGSGFALLHSFAGGANDGLNPSGSIILYGAALYGMTYGGGNGDAGTVFTLNTDGTGFALLHEFAGGIDDGQRPFGSLSLSGSTLYGMTYRGGDSNNGTLFELNADGTGFTLLHEFAGGADDGGLPMGSLALSDSALYGMTLYGGSANNFGTVFRFGLVPEPPSFAVAAASALLLAIVRRRKPHN